MSGACPIHPRRNWLLPVMRLCICLPSSVRKIRAGGAGVCALMWPVWWRVGISALGWCTVPVGAMSAIWV